MLAKIVAQELGIKELDTEKIKINMSYECPMPVIVHKNECRLWVDKHYIAFSKDNNMLVQYVYVDNEHASEELAAMTKLIANESDSQAIEMLIDLKMQFREAMFLMNSKSERYYLLEKYKLKLTDLIKKGE